MSEFHKHSEDEFDYDWEAGRNRGDEKPEFYWSDHGGYCSFYVRGEDGRIMGKVQSTSDGPDRYYKAMRWGTCGGGEGVFRCIGCYIDAAWAQVKVQQAVNCVRE